MLLDLLGRLLDLLHERARVGAEGRRHDHAHLGQLVTQDDLPDERELDHVHADLGVDDGPERVEDGQLAGARTGVESRGGPRGRHGRGVGRGLGHDLGGGGFGGGVGGKRLFGHQGNPSTEVGIDPVGVPVGRLDGDQLAA